jgi:Zn-dependent M28 family amino/carboxypeptidase
MDRENRIQSFPLKTELSFQGEFQYREFISANVLALLEGRDEKLKDTYLILSAHYDHLGLGPPVNGDAIYNGVMDNAAGVAAVLEIARVLSSSEGLRRSILFVLTTGEEKGLLGSRYYVEHPAVPLYKTVANINVDGLASFDTFNDMVGIGADLSTLGIVLSSVLSKKGLRLSPVPSEFSQREAFTRSDQVAFAEAGIPALLVMDGLSHRHTSTDIALKRFLDWGNRIYHSPQDDLFQPLNLKAAKQHNMIILELCRALANSEEAPEWYPGSPFALARLQSIAEGR